MLLQLIESKILLQLNTQLKKIICENENKDDERKSFKINIYKTNENIINEQKKYQQHLCHLLYTNRKISATILYIRQRHSIFYPLLTDAKM